MQRSEGQSDSRPAELAAPLGRKAAIELDNWQIAHSWHTGLRLTYAGVDLGDLMTYPILATLGRVWVNHFAESVTESVPPNA